MEQQSFKSIIVKVGQEEYALNVDHVLSIEKIQQIRPMPHSKEYMAGVMELRGLIIPVLDLRLWLGLTSVQEDLQANRIVVGEVDGKRLGMIVDSATDVLDIDPKAIQVVNLKNGFQDTSEVANLNGRMILILNVPDLIEKLNVEDMDTAV